MGSEESGRAEVGQEQHRNHRALSRMFQVGIFFHPEDEGLSSGTWGLGIMPLG